MLGILRLFLAAAVVYYHCSYKPYGYLMGVVAVVVFYMLSGFVVTGLYKNAFNNQKMLAFYRDRCLRLLPQYYFYLLLYTLFFGFTYWFIQGSQLTFQNLFSNFTLLPMAIKNLFPTPANFFPIIGPAHSLALETVCYLLLPLIAFRQLGALLFCLVLMVFCFATHSLLPVEQFTYSEVPGVLIFFFLGHYLYQKNYKVLTFAILILIFNHIHLIMIDQFYVGYNKDLYLGIYFGLFSIQLLRNYKSNAFDKWCGAVTYGCFLSHYGLILIIGHYQLLSILAGHDFLYATVLLGISIICGWLTYALVEKKVADFRKRLQKKTESDKSIEALPVLIA